MIRVFYYYNEEVSHFVFSTTEKFLIKLKYQVKSDPFSPIDSESLRTTHYSLDSLNFLLVLYLLQSGFITLNLFDTTCNVSIQLGINLII